MSGDIGLFWDVQAGAADLAIVDNDLATDGGLETAILLSLFLDARAEDGDVLPDGTSGRRGWWADEFAEVDGDRIGSCLWLLGRAKATAAEVARQKELAAAALQWLVTDRVAESVDVESEIVGNEIVGLFVSVYRPKTDPAKFRFPYAWAAQEVRR